MKQRSGSKIGHKLFDSDLLDYSGIIIPTVSMLDEPKIKIYDHSNDGTYWYRKIGFTSKINEE